MVKSCTPDDLYATLERLPEHLVGEILAGELVVSPRPTPRHANTATVAGADLLSAFGRGSGSGWWILFEPELHLGPDVVIPDVAGWRREKMPTLPDTAYFTLAPDWVCEILSAHTAGIDRVHKLPLYARERVPFAWLVDPLEKTLEAFRLGSEGWIIAAPHQGDVTVRVPPFESLALDLSAWWVP